MSPPVPTLPPRHKSPIDVYANIDSAPLPPIAPDGGIAAGTVGAPAPLPEATPQTFICLRGPCRYYGELKVHLDIGNPAQTFDPVHGLRDMAPCPNCAGRGQVMATPDLAPSDDAACGYRPSQGIHREIPCRLVANHAGAHHHVIDEPAPRWVPCMVCEGNQVVPLPDGKPVKAPRQIVRTCMRQPGCETDLTETLVYECNQWDPGDPKELRQLQKRRETFLENNPDLVVNP
ncbi:MAG: hypothetical protein IT338_17255 [Thermomicrobiales bacterium]|nr:hypothetical protein [Thermomicrobiales bacterium]